MEQNKDAEYYLKKGNKYFEKNEYEKAIKNYEKAIELDKAFKEAYYNRGNIYSILKQYEKAKENFTKAIELDNNYKEAYCNRGIVYSNLKQYEEAIKDFTKAIELDNNYKKAYCNRGIVYSNLKQYEEAIKDFTKVIDNNYKKVIEYFNEFIFLNKTNNIESRNNDILPNISFTDNVLNFLYDILIDCQFDLENEEKKTLVELVINIYKLIEKFKVNEPKQLLYYTKSTTLKFLLHNEKDTEKDENGKSIFPKLRLNNAVYMNDPEEGKFFKKILSEIDKKDKLNKNFTTLDDEHLLNNKDYTYLTCFSPLEEKDKLPMWVHYGDGGKGVSIVFNEKFFKNTELYKVKYLDVNNISNDDTFKEVKEEIENIYNVLVKVKSEKEIFLQLTNVVLNYVSYLFKDKAYSYEQEVRIIKLRDYNDVKIDKQYDVPKLYIDFETPITSEMIDEIIIGPKGDFEAILAYAKYVGIKKVSKSKIKYR